MKLWHKIFIGTLLLVMLAVDGTSFLLLSQSQNMLFQQEQKRAASEHSLVAAAVQNTVTVTRLQQNKTLLSEEDTYAVVEKVLDSQKKRGAGVSLYRAGKRISTTGVMEEAQELDVVKAVTAEAPQLKFITQDARSCLLVGCQISREKVDYSLVTMTDATDLSVLRREQLRYVRTLSLVLSLVVAGLLLVMVWWLMRPLQKVNYAMRRIAQGDYQKRLQIAGHSELAELARNVNRMADSIETNVDSLEQVADNQKTFIANLAHEMKTPLTSILGFADILRVKKVVTEAERREYAGVIVEETKRLRSLSGKLMELITVGNTQLDFQRISLPDLVREVEISLQPSLALREMNLRCVVPDVEVRVDKELFKSLLYNLADNAMKASKAGQTVEFLGGLAPDGHLVLIVSDSGMGIPQKEIAKIVQPFYMLDKVRSRKAGGAGLGLALCVEIARLHGIRLTIESELGKGTQVYLTFDGEAEA